MAKKAKKAAPRKKAAKAPAKAMKKAVKKTTATKKTVKKSAPKAKTAAKTAAKAAVKAPPKPKAPEPKKTRLRPKELEEFRNMLLEKRRTLVGDLSGIQQEAFSQNSSGNLSSMPTHMADVGTDNFEHEFNLGLLESEQAMLHEINEALQRIENRTYGICLGTGQTIPKARLRAKPWAKYTVDYARMLEKGLVREPDRDNGITNEDEED